MNAHAKVFERNAGGEDEAAARGSPWLGGS